MEPEASVGMEPEGLHGLGLVLESVGRLAVGCWAVVGRLAVVRRGMVLAASDDTGLFVTTIAGDVKPGSGVK